MKRKILSILVIFIVHAIAHSNYEGVTDNKMQMVCARKNKVSSRMQTLVITQMSHSIGEAKDLFSYDDVTSDFESEDIELKVEMFSEKVELSKAKEQVLSLSRDSLEYTAVATGSRNTLIFYFIEDDHKNNQFNINLTRMNVGGIFNHEGDRFSFKCVKAYETTYVPFEKEQPETEKEEMVEEVHASLATEEEYAID